MREGTFSNPRELPFQDFDPLRKIEYFEEQLTLRPVLERVDIRFSCAHNTKSLTQSCIYYPRSHK